MGMAQDFDATDVRHLDIGNYEIVDGCIELAFSQLAGVDRFDFVAFAAQRDVEHLADGAFIVANKNVSHALPPLRRRLLPVFSFQSLPRSRLVARCWREFRPQPAVSNAARIRFPVRAWTVPKLFLRAPGLPDTQWRDPALCRLRTAIEKAQKSCPPTAAISRGQCPRN